MRIRLDDAVYPVRFIVVSRLACQVLLGTHFLDHRVDAIKCRQRVLYLTGSIVPIMGVVSAATPRQKQQAPNNTAPEPKFNQSEPKNPQHLHASEVQPRGPKAEHEVGPVTTQRASAPPEGAGPVQTPSGAPLPKDWKDLVDLPHITDEKLKARILNMLAPHKDMWSGDLRKIRVTEHNIDLKPGTRPLHQHPYRAGPESRKVLEDHINVQLAADVIGPAQSQWDSTVLQAPKKDGTLRFCADFWRLNALTIPDTYPLPQMEDCLDILGEARLFTTLEALWGYWQVPIAELDRNETTFTSHMGTLRYKRMPFGLRNAPTTFQRALDIILSGVRWKTCLIYIDDVVIFSKTEEEHFAQVIHVLTLLGEAGVKLKLKKCFFFH